MEPDVQEHPRGGAQIEAALAPPKEAIFHTARLEGRHEPGEAYAADALAEMARRSVAADDPAGEAEGDSEEAEPTTPVPATPADPEGDAAAAADPVRRPARSRRPDTKVIVLISYEALKRGLAEADERGVAPAKELRDHRSHIDHARCTMDRAGEGCTRSWPPTRTLGFPQWCSDATACSWKHWRRWRPAIRCEKAWTAFCKPRWEP